MTTAMVSMFAFVVVVLVAAGGAVGPVAGVRLGYSSHTLRDMDARKAQTHAMSAASFVHPPKDCLQDRSRETIFGVMVTGKDCEHKQLAHYAAESFHNQTYPSKFLIVVNDGGYNMTKHACQHEIRPAGNSTLSLGQLRNLGLKAVPINGVWTQWDDDDWRPPYALTKQYECLVEAQLSSRSRETLGAVLQNQWQVSLHQNATFLGHLNAGIMGTIMVRATPRVKRLQYPSDNRREDSVYLRELQRQGPVHACENDPDWYYRLIHGGNTWGAAHFRLGHISNNTWCAEKPEPGQPNQIPQLLQQQQQSRWKGSRSKPARRACASASSSTLEHTRQVFDLYQPLMNAFKEYITIPGGSTTTSASTSHDNNSRSKGIKIC